ncbi:isoprenylcysteine carboxylmethyltransferase family protein [Flavobacteriales bacterium]|nr:isoprenylcysteine carboxylmethyltransferase family protein [Flavobacteriales bacterium]|tara:strand:+ start:2035 stop:2487 length:453 start_codon:yes stop_codon:yes gene_type:complete
MEKFSKIPPPLVVLILVISTFFSSKKIDLIQIPFQSLISIFILSIGILILLNPVLKFKKSKTTINPIKFKKVNKLVTSGIYKYSRNPMYLGLLMIVISSSIFYLNIYSILTPLFFYLWINRFQIKREEVFLTEKFGEDYLSYKKKTRRWI